MSQYDLDSNVLFIGHSLVGPLMPGMVQAAAESAGGSPDVDAQIINGAPLTYQWANGATAEGVNARAVLPSGQYDVVVMTEAVPLINHLTWSDPATYAKNYYDLAVSNNPDARVYIYETWHSLLSGTGADVPWDDEDHIPWRQRIENDLTRWESIVNDVNAELAPDQPEVMMIPAGQAMGLLFDRIEAGQVPGVSSIGELFIDDIHPNELGNYFLTMVQYATIYGDDPRDLPLVLDGVSGPVSQAQADVLQDIAWTAVISYDGSGVVEGDVPPPPPQSDFDPDAADDSATTGEDEAVTIDVLANDSDPDGNGLSISAVADPSGGNVGIVNGEIVYTPDTGFMGADSFSYTVADANGDADTATVTVTVEGAAPPPDPNPDDFGDALTNPGIGMNLALIADWSPQFPFVDIMKTGREWIGHSDGQWWGGWSYDQLLDGGYLDADGWPTEIPDGVWGISALILTDLAPETAEYTSGRYRVTYEGEGEVVIANGGVTNVEYGDGEIWFDFEPTQGPVEVRIVETDPNGNGNYVRDISVVHEDNVPAFESGEIFNPMWLETVDDFRSVRFMDWMATNNSDQSEWANRPQVDDFTWAREGVPVEIMVELANQIGADPWFTIPHQATDEYIREFAEYVRDNLDPSLRASVEYSNEVWNWQFEQAQWAEEQGLARWGESGTWTQFAAARGAEMAQIWSEVFAEEADDRLNLVLGIHPGWLGLEQNMLNGPLWVAEDPENNLPPYMYFDSYATTGYFSGDLGYGDRPTIVLEWIAESETRAIAEADALNLTGSQRETYIEENRYDYAVELAIQELRDGSVTGDPQNTLQQLIETNFAYHANVAEQYGLDLTMYEGGTHVVGIGEWINNEELTAFFQYLNYTEEMGELYDELLQGWVDAGGTMFTAYEDVYAPTEYGSWGHLRHLADDNPRWDALIEFLENNPAWWGEDRDADAFIGTSEAEDGTGEGILDLGTGGNDDIDGSGGNDTLSGGNGNDTLSGGAGLDYIRGGSNNDRIDGGAQADNLGGGNGNDTIHGGQGLDQIFGGFGDDELHGGDDADRILAQVGNDRVFGNSGDDTLHGGQGIDLLYGGFGDDDLRGGTDADQLFGQDGNDRLFGDTDNDTLSGGDGFDFIRGGSDNDLIHGGAQPDNLGGDNGNDTIYGEQGIDLLYGGFGDDDLRGGTDADQLFGQVGNDRLFGDTGNDSLYGGNGFDFIRGGNNDDLIHGGAQADNLGGDNGNDTIYGGQGNDLLYGGFGDDRLHGGTNADRLFGQDGNDRLFGDNGHDLMNGGDGDDVLHGQFGHDTLHGGNGDDTLTGFYGYDYLRGDGGNDVIYGGALADNLGGGNGNDMLLGGQGNDLLFGGFGNDRLEGGADNDALWGGPGSDTFVFANGHGDDTVKDFNADSPWEKLDFSALSSINTMSQLNAAAVDTAEGVLITTSANSSILLEGVTEAQLDTSDFIFV